MNGTIERTETRAAVVVETEWTRPARKHHPEATVRSRTGHVDPECARIDGEIVARDVPLDSPDAGLPCDYCVPNLRGEVVVTAAERDYEANRPEPPSGNGNGSRRAPVSDEPSEAQVTFWKNLRTDYFLVLGLSPDAAAEAVAAEETRIRERGGWSRSFFAKNDTIGDAKNDLYVARKLAETRGSTVSTPAAPAAPADGIETNGRANRYGGECPRCGSYVAEGAGLLGKRNGKWLAVHKPGECVEKGSVEAPAPAAPLADVPEGHYAIRSTGSNDLSFYRIDRPADGPHAGKVYAKLIVGGHPDRNVAWKAIPGILARIAEAGVVESATLYGREVGSCSRCNRHLTHAVSRFAGYGPKCREILGISVSKSQKQLAVEMALRLGWDVEIDGEERD